MRGYLLYQIALIILAPLRLISPVHQLNLLLIVEEPKGPTLIQSIPKHSPMTKKLRLEPIKGLQKKNSIRKGRHEMRKAYVKTHREVKPADFLEG